jgi:hypothetical protein
VGYLEGPIPHLLSGPVAGYGVTTRSVACRDGELLYRAGTEVAQHNLAGGLIEGKVAREEDPDGAAVRRSGYSNRQAASRHIIQHLMPIQRRFRREP